MQRACDEAFGLVEHWNQIELRPKQNEIIDKKENL